MKKRTLTIALCAMMASVSVMADEEPNIPFWNDPQKNADNRLDNVSTFFAYESEALAEKGVKAQSKRFLSIEGNWKFNWVKNANDRPQGFYEVDYIDTKWDRMPVPGNWEMNGYGDAIYVNNQYAWRSDWNTNPPYVQDLGNHVGSYRRTFKIPADWKGQKVYIHIGSATSNITIWVNGKYAGYSEDSKVACEFDITPYVKPGEENLVAMQIMRWCDGSYLEDQDFWRLCGISRECYMYARPEQHIHDIFITPDLTPDYRDGMLTVKTTMAEALKSGEQVVLTLKDAEGKTVKEATVKGSAKESTTVISLADCKKWNAESPYLYSLYATLKSGNKTVEVLRQKVGFRKVEIKNRQLLVNGKPVLIKGVDRHELDPDKGYCVSYEQMVKDIEAMKKLNVNAVRTCHYPDDPRWYELCDEYGIYVTAETNIESHGMGYGEGTLARRADYHDAHIERQKHNMMSFKNHPSIIVWSLGNESGYGKNFEDAYDWVKAYDPSRPCQYEQAGQNGKTDIFCPMYYDYNGCDRYSQGDNPRPLIQCEYAHAMGNSIGGFKEYWDLVRKHPAYQGGYIWDFIDQGFRGKSKVTGKQIWTYGGDYGRYPASDNNFNCNGIITPDRRLTPQSMEVQYYYQNIWTTLKDKNSGKIEIYNENFFEPINNITLHYTIEADGHKVDEGTVDISKLKIKPQTKKEVTIPAIAKAIKNKEYAGKELVCTVSYQLDSKESLLAAGYEVAHDQFVLTDYKYLSIDDFEQENFDNLDDIRFEDHAIYYLFQAKDVDVTINKHTGFISHIDVFGQPMMEKGYELRPDFWRAATDNDHGAGMQRSLRGWMNPNLRLTSIKQELVSDSYIVTAEYTIGIGQANNFRRGPQQQQPQQQAQPQQPRLTLTYVINRAGTIFVTEKMTVGEDGSKFPQMLRYGMELQMPKNYDTVEFYGKGPFENYIDRQGAARLGIYKQKVAEQYWQDYVRPQESGNKTNVRYWSVINSEGKGLRFASNEPMECQSIPYLTSDLDPSENKAQWHSGDLTPRPFTSVHISQRQMGLGCVNSWGAWPRQEYQMPCQDRKFWFVITPLK